MPDIDRLEHLNDRFIEIYETARRDLLAAQKQAALLLIDGEEMVFFRRGREPEVIAGLRPPLYTKLKILGHVPLAIFSLLTAEAGAGALSAGTLAELAAYRGRLHACAADLDTGAEVDAGALPRPMTIVERSLAFLDALLDQGHVSAADLDTFAGGMTAEVNLLFAAAARAQLDALHGHVLRLKRSVLTHEEWSELRVVVMGPHMAHKEDLFLQYFSRVLHTPMYTDKRLVYYEGNDRNEALDLLGTTLIDFRVSRAFFKDENRMHRDVLSDATRDYLGELLSGENDRSSKRGETVDRDDDA